MRRAGKRSAHGLALVGCEPGRLPQSRGCGVAPPFLDWFASAALGTTDEALLKAIQVVGPRVDRVKDYLGAGGMAGDQVDA
jgi:hypothetical protein